MDCTITNPVMPKRAKNITGIRRGLLVASKYLRCGENRHAIWLAQCDCGKTHEVESAAFIRWQYRSCGCYRDQAIGNANRTHGMTKRPEYQAWLKARSRTRDPNDPSFKNYGGRVPPITMSDELYDSFDAFFEELGERPEGDYSVDRKNNDRGYERGNIKWSTAKEQARNRRSNRLLTHNGETITVAEWTERLGMSKAAIRLRLRAGWSIEDAVTTPRMKQIKSPPDDFEWAGYRIISD